MNWKNLTVIVCGAVVLFGFCFFQIPENEKATVFNESVKSITLIFRVNFWIFCTIVLSMVSLFLFFRIGTQKKYYERSIDDLNKRISELKGGSQ